jgi:hypothetical protein
MHKKFEERLEQRENELRDFRRRVNRNWVFAGISLLLAILAYGFFK